MLCKNLLLSHSLSTGRADLQSSIGTTYQKAHRVCDILFHLECAEEKFQLKEKHNG